jgi:hypothetical protein
MQSLVKLVTVLPMGPFMKWGLELYWTNQTCRMVYK